MGHLLDKYSVRILLSGTMLLLVITMITVQVMATPWHSFVYAALQGLMGGIYRVMDSTVWAKYFGRLHLGSIRGATMIGVIGATSVGPYALGLSLDFLGSYSPVLMGLMPVPLTIAVLALFVKRPERQ
jgi:MFS family permease